jgi:hypothetical protein
VLVSQRIIWRRAVRSGTERTREIGIRLVINASRKEAILFQRLERW